MAVVIKDRNPLNNNLNFENNCVCNIVRVVDQRQKEAQLQESCLNCEGNLGEQFPTANTRPFILYLPNGDEFMIRISPLSSGAEAQIQQETNADRTPILRVEEMRGCCALVRGLRCSTPPAQVSVKQVLPSSLECTPFCCWVDLTQCIGVQCFSDTFIPLPCPIINNNTTR